MMELNVWPRGVLFRSPSKPLAKKRTAVVRNIHFSWRQNVAFLPLTDIGEKENFDFRTRLFVNYYVTKELSLRI